MDAWATKYDLCDFGDSTYELNLCLKLELHKINGKICANLWLEQP
jgi:hypothetical protein